MKKQEKIAKYMAQGLTKEQAERLIPYGQNDYLTLEELAVKYNNPNLLTGEYPDWLTPEEHFRLCCVVAATKYEAKKFKWFYMSREDLEMDLYIYTVIRLPKIKNYAMLKTALCNRVKNILRDNVKKETFCVKTEDATEEQLQQFKFYNRINGDTYIAGSLDNYIVDEYTGEFSNLIQSDNNSVHSKVETVEIIRSIKNKQVRQILIVCGYLLADLDELYIDYRQVLQSCSKRVKQNLHKLCKKQLMYEDYKCGKIELEDDMKKLQQVTITDIIAAFDLKEQLSNMCTDTVNMDKLKSVTQTYKKSKSQNSLKQKLITQRKLAQSLTNDLKYYLVENNLFGSVDLL